MKIPAQLVHYPCGEYFESVYAEEGFWDADAQLHVIVKADEAKEFPDLKFFQMAVAGVDGILFGYREGEPGIWAYYPNDREFTLVATTLVNFVEKWNSNGIVL